MRASSLPVLARGPSIIPVVVTEMVVGNGLSARFYLPVYGVGPSDRTGQALRD